MTPLTIEVTVPSSQLLELVSGNPLTAQVTPGHGGSGYAPGDTGQILGGNNNSAYKILSVDLSGSALTISLFQGSAGAHGYSVSGGYTTNVVTGSGDGNLQIDILSVTSAVPVPVTPTIPGKVIVPGSISVLFNPGSDAYEVSGSLGLDYADGSGNTFGSIQTALLQKTVRSASWMQFAAGQYADSPAGQPVVLHGNGAGIYGGNGTLTVITTYNVK